MRECNIENKKLINRVSRIQGQLNGLKKRLESECDEEHNPYEIIRQLSAIKGAINGMINSYVEHYAKEHIVKGIKSSKDDIEAMAVMDGLVEIMKSFGK